MIVPVDKDHTVIVVVVVCTSRISTVVVIVVDSTEPFRVVLVDGGMQYLYDRHKLRWGLGVISDGCWALPMSHYTMGKS